MNLEKAYLLSMILFLFGIAFTYVNFVPKSGKQESNSGNSVFNSQQNTQANESENEEQLEFKVNFTDELANKFIKKYESVAIAEMKQYKIPASITLAQGLLESTAGTSRLATTANNYFGIKCFSKSCKKGHCKNFTDDSHKDFFRVNKTVWESFRQHSQLLQKERYKKCYRAKDWKEWTVRLKECGYATDKDYPQKLENLIRKYELYKYDN